MKEIVIDLIENESENTRLDFKVEQYPIEKSNPKKLEFLKDMCAFSNLNSKEDKFVIIGVQEDNGRAVSFKSIESLHDQASYQQFVNEYIEPEINFEYTEMEHLGHRLAYFRIFNNEKRPYLFKKEFTTPKGSLFRIGAGFIRSGSSTRELRREDLEKIYTERISSKDRSKDIDVEISFERFTSWELKDSIYQRLQVDLINLSNTSIDLDVEGRILNNKEVQAKCSQDLESSIYNKRRDTSLFAYTNSLDKMIPPFAYINTHVVFKRHDNYSVYDRYPVNTAPTGVRVKQKGKVEDVFNGQIALVFSRPADLEIEIIVRSDDFPNGPKVFPFSFSAELTSQLLDPWDL